MAKRDHVAEVLEVKNRIGHRWLLPGNNDVDDLARKWASCGDRLIVLDYFPTRLVTIIEVFTRRWIERLIDDGQPYLGNAAGLEQSGTKLDFAASAAIQGRRVSVGQLVAHSVPLNRLGQVGSCFSTVLGEDFFASIENTYDRFKVEREGAPRTPIIPDLARMKRELCRLFEVRHIAVHEMPREPPCTEIDVNVFLRATSDFIRATEQTLLNRVTPNYPLGILDAAVVAGDASRTVQASLDEVVAAVEPLVRDPKDRNLLRRSQDAWREYAELQAQLRSCGLEGGALQPVVYHREMERLGTARTEELRWWLDREEGEV